MANTAFGELQTAELTPVAGWTFSYNVNADIVTATELGDGDVTSANGLAVLSTTAAINSSAYIQTVRPLRYLPGQGGLARFTAYFTTGVAGSYQIIGVGDDQDGFFFGYNGADFGILRRVAGSDSWTAATSWTENTGSANAVIFDPTKGNVYQIQFQWLGFGEIRYFIENPRTGEFALVHRIKYANTATTTSIRNPTLPIYARATNTTNNSDIVLRTPSAMAFVEGKLNDGAPHPLDLQRTLDNAKTTITTGTNLLTLKSLAQFQGVNNRVRSRLTGMTVAVDGTKNATVKIVKNTTLGGSPSYANYNADTSPVQYDTAGTTLTGGTLLFVVELAKVDSRVVDLRPYGIEFGAGDIVTASVTSTANTDADVSLHWTDLF